MTTTAPPAGTRDNEEGRLWDRAAAQTVARTGTATGSSKGGEQRQLREKEGGAGPYCLTAERTERSSLGREMYLIEITLPLYHLPV